MIALSITNVLGETRAVEHAYDDGSYTCPFCGTAVIASEGADCHNPACDAGIYADRENAEHREQERRERREREEHDRRHHEQARVYAREQQERERAELWEAIEDGYCAVCFVRSNHRKRVRHRRSDFHASR